ncbi:hypothetical protein JCM10908_005752 [Rhodotorula pacifica]|uniref:alpha/beta hydrolase family protein n=1 Tax=Rhodotorula pacifica TaxID=1495444 RepID=UPI00317877F0
MLRIWKASLFGLKLPEPSNEPLAGTIADGAGPPWFFLLQVLVGLPTALWAYKCLMLVLFQRRIIYLPSVPPGTRDEPVPDQTGELSVQEVCLSSEEPSRWLRREIQLHGIEVDWGGVAAATKQQRHVVIVYLQGNAGTPLLRLPVFRTLLQPDPTDPSQPRITLLAVAPRSYWLSDRTTPTQKGVLGDYTAALRHAREMHGPDATYILYGHSLGGAAATLLLLRQIDQLDNTSPPISGLILENPLPSIPYMVRALYPQRWLPYHYLGPFAFDKWDALSALEQHAGQLSQGSRAEGSGAREKIPPSLWIRSGRDEIIPHGSSDGVRQMYAAWRSAEESVLQAEAAAAGTAVSCQATAAEPGSANNSEGGADRHPKEVYQQRGRALELGAKWVDVPHALHDTAFTEKRWRDEIRQFVAELSKR